MNNFKKLSQKTIAMMIFASVLILSLLCTCLLYNAPAKVSAEETAFTKVSHYKFDDASNLGKDSLGNYNLTNKGGVVYDEENGGVTVGTDSNCVLYSPKDGSGKDLSDYISGSYSLSIRARLTDVSSGTKLLVSTGYAQNSTVFSIQRAFTSLYFNTGLNTIQVPVGLTSTPTWCRITVIYSADTATSTYTYRIVISSEAGYSYDQTHTLSGATKFGNYYQAEFCIGGAMRSLNNDANFLATTATVSDVRVYSGVLGDKEISAIAKEDAENYAKKQLNDNSTIIGASIRLSDESGLRFHATLNERVVNSYVETYGAENVSFGTYIVRTHNEEKAYAYVSAINNTLTDGVYSFNAVITGLTSEYYGTTYTAYVYIAYTVDGETTYVCTETGTDKSISAVAQTALSLTYTVDVDGTLEDKPTEYTYLIEDGVYSVYSIEVRAQLSAFLAN